MKKPNTIDSNCQGNNLVISFEYEGAPEVEGGEGFVAMRYGK